MPAAARDTALHALLPVERLLRHADPAAVSDLLELRVALESTAGRTVTRGRAARFLALTQTSVDRWIADGAIPTVIDIDGKTMVPTRELVRLRVEMDAARWQGAQRPLGVVVRQRRERAKAVPLGEIAPPELLAELASTGHRRAEVVDLAVHRLLARDLDERAPTELCASITADTVEAARLRQTSPFKGLVAHEDRRALMHRLVGAA